MNLITSPDQLPLQAPPRLIGRDELMNAIRQHLSPQNAVFLYGISGVGKRAVAAALASEILQAGQPVLWLSPNDLTHPPVIRLLQEHQPLVVVNGLASHEVAAQFIWEHTRGRARVLVLHSVAADGPWEPLLVRRLDATASYQLFQELLGYPLSTPDNLQPPALLDDLQGHPLSIRLAALQVKHKLISLTEFRLALPPQINDPLQRALSVIETAFKLLDPPSQGLLMAMSASFSEGISAALLARFLGTSAHDLCRRLMERGFISRRDVPYYDMPPLVQKFARQQLDANGRLDEAQNRMVNALTGFVAIHQDQPDTLLLEIDNLLNAAHFCIEASKSLQAQHLSTAFANISEFMRQWGYQSELDSLQQLASIRQTQPSQTPAPVIEASEIIDEDEAWVESLEKTVPAADTQPRKPKEMEGLVATVINTRTTALTTPQQNLQMTLTDATTRNDRPEMARIAMQLGQLELDHREIDPALEHFEQAVQLYQEIGDLGKLLRALEITAEQFRLYRSPEQAQNYAQRGLNIARQMGNDASRCLFMGIIGDIRLSMGDSNGASEAYKRAIKLARLMGESENTGILLGKLATIYLDNRDYRSATISLSEAISLFDQAHRLDLMGRSLGNLGTALGHLGRWQEAGQRHAAALRIARQLQDVEEERFQLQNLAFVAESEGHMRWAVNYARQALYLALLEDDDSATSEIAFDLGRMLSSDPEAIGQVVILLQKAVDLNPQAEIQQMLKEAKVRLRKREQSGRHIAEVEPDLIIYAGEAYRGHSS